MPLLILHFDGVVGSVVRHSDDEPPSLVLRQGFFGFCQTLRPCFQMALFVNCSRKRALFIKESLERLGMLFDGLYGTVKRGLPTDVLCYD